MVLHSDTLAFYELHELRELYLSIPVRVNQVAYRVYIPSISKQQVVVVTWKSLQSIFQLRPIDVFRAAVVKTKSLHERLNGLHMLLVLSFCVVRQFCLSFLF